MRRPIKKILQGLLLLVMAGVFLASAGSYLVRRWRLEEVRRNTPAALPAGVEQQTEKFTFSRSEEGVTLFTVEAARSSERSNRSIVLEEVSVVIHGKEGDRADEIRAAQCIYDLNATEIYCPGQVEIILRSGEAEQGSREQFTIETDEVRFDIEEESARTDSAVSFSWPQGEGKAVGLRYYGRSQALELVRDVTIKVRQYSGGPLLARGAGLQYNARGRVLALLSPLAVQFQGGSLRASSLRMTLNERYRTERIEATGGVRFRARYQGKPWNVEAAQVIAQYRENGSVELMRADGAVNIFTQREQGSSRLNAREVILHLAEDGSLVNGTARGDAEMRSERAGSLWTASGQRLEMVGPDLEQEKGVFRVVDGGKVSLGRETVAYSIEAGTIELASVNGRPRKLQAADKVTVRDGRAGTGKRTTRSDNLLMEFTEAGELESAQQWGTFRYKGAFWEAQAGKALYRAEDGAYELEEEPVLEDARSRTTATRFEIREKDRTVMADGEVRTTVKQTQDMSAGASSGTPIHLAAPRMTAHFDEGWVRYSGGARLWQGDNRLAAETIELRRNTRALYAEGSVQAFLFEKNKEVSLGSAAARKGNAPRTVEITSQRFTFAEPERTGVFEDGVRVRSQQATLEAPRLEVKLRSEEGRERNRLESVQASGGARTESGGRVIVSERVDYNIVAGTIVFSGGTPTLQDPQNGSTSAARLTLFLADDTLLAESEQGVRTVTRRPGAQ